MKTNKKFIVTLSLSLALMCVLATPTISRADAWDHATKLTFSEPVEVPGDVLPAGTYWFTLADSQSNRNIVQIWTSDRSHLVRTILAIPHYRTQTADETVIKFAERPSDSPEAIRSWVYPGANFGQEFVYPKPRAVELAKQISEPVLTEREPTVEAPAVQIAAVSPSGEEMEVADVIVTEEAPAMPASLPQTGSMLPLIGLLGMLSLAGGITLRAVTQK
jgi:hypothetical protein